MEQQINYSSESAQKIIDDVEDMINTSGIDSEERWYAVATFIDDIVMYDLSVEQWGIIYDLNEKLFEYEENSAYAEDSDTKSVKEMEDGC